MLSNRLSIAILLLFSLFLKPGTVFAQFPVITPKNNIVLHLDASGAHPVSVDEVATISSTNGVTPVTRISPAVFDCNSLGPQTVTVDASEQLVPTPGVQFNHPFGIAKDAQGNFYIADAGNFKIKKIAADGVVTTFAGNGTLTISDGIGLDAGLGSPVAIITDAQGNLYVAVGDPLNSRSLIRKITPAGVVTTFATRTTSPEKKFSTIDGLAIDGQGNIYAADDVANIIYKITPAGIVAVFAGSGNPGSADGTGVSASFNSPGNLAIDAAGNIYVADSKNNKIRKITPAGVVTTFAGTGAADEVNGTIPNVTFARPVGITFDNAGNMYVTDGAGIAVRKITPAGIVTSILAGLDILRDQISIIADDAGYLYVVTYDNLFVKLSQNGYSTYIGGGPSGDRNTYEPGFSDGYYTTVNIPVTVISNPVFEPISPVLTADANCQGALPDYTKLAKVSPCAGKLKITQSPAAGTVVNAALPVNVTLTAIDGFGGKGTVSFNVSVSSTPVITPNQQPIVLTLDATGKYQVKLSDVATVSTCNNPIATITPSSFACADAGNQTVTIEAHNPSPAEFNYPVGMIYDASGNLYVVDRNNHAVRKITPDGIVSTFAGTGNEGHLNGKGTAASFGDINAITIDSHGNLYVTDYKYADIRKIAPDGTVTTFIGNIACNQMVMDKQDNMFVTTIHACLKKITPDGTISDFAGTEAIGYLDATGTAARFSFIDGITIDGSGNLYVLDYGNYKIRMISPNAVVTTLPINGGFVPGGYVAIDGFGNLFIASSERVWERKVNGECVDFVGSNVPSGPGNNDGIGTAAKFNTVQGVVFDSSGNLLVADAVDNAIRKVTPDAEVSTYAGGIQGYNNGAIAHGISVYASIPVTVVAPQALAPSVKVTPDSYGGCEGQSLTYTAIATNAGNNPVYQWKVNGQNAGANASEFTSLTLKTGDKITCTVTTSATCAVATATSNEASLTADPTVSNSVSITSTAVNNVIKPGQQVTFTAKAVVTDNVVYQWLVNNVSAGTNSPIFTANNMQNGDAVTCTVTTYGKCIATPYVVSNTLTMTIYAPVDVVNTFTPNGDGINDTWEIPTLSAYPNCAVNIFSRYGTMVYKSVGYARPWDGTFNAKQVPSGTYYYIIDLKNGKDKITGAVTILR